MKARLALILLCIALVAPAAWTVRARVPVQVNEFPEKYRDTVQKGLDYLVKHQHKDGHWEGPDGKHPVATTALAGMALLMEGSNVDNGKYSADIRKAVDWLMDQSKPERDGLIFSGHASETERYMQGHGLATQFLAWSYRREKDQPRRKKMEEVLGKSLKYIAKAQSTKGGWHSTSKVEGHDLDQVSTTAIQIQALYMVTDLGFPVRSETAASDGQEYLKKAIAKFGKDAKPDPKRNRIEETAAALACRCCPDAHLDQDGLNPTWMKYCKTAVPMGADLKFGRDELTHFYYAQAVFNHALNSDLSSEVAWNEYRKVMFDHLQSKQNKDGSWPGSADAGGSISVGPIYTTAIWCTVLQFEKKCHPLTRTRILETF